MPATQLLHTTDPQATVKELLTEMLELKTEGIISDLSVDSNSEWNTGMGEHGLGQEYNVEKHYEATLDGGGCARGPMKGVVPCLLLNINCASFCSGMP